MAPSRDTHRTLLAYARKGVVAVLGSRAAYQSSLWIGDAARAVVAALERAPSGTYDVVDDEPLQRAELVTLIARAVGKERRQLDKLNQHRSVEKEQHTRRTACWPSGGLLFLLCGEVTSGSRVDH